MPKLSLPVRPRRGVAVEAGSTGPLAPTTVSRRRPTLLLGLAALIAVLLILLLTVVLPALRSTPTASPGALGPLTRPSPGSGGSPTTAPPSTGAGSAGAGSVVRDPFAMQYDANSTAPSPALSGTSGLGSLPGGSGVVTYPGSGSAGAGTLSFGPTPVTTQPTPTSGGGTTAPPGGTTASPTPAPAPASVTHTSVQLTTAPTVSGSTYQASFVVDGGTRYVATVGGTFAGSLIFRSVQTAADGTLYAVLQYAGQTPFDIHAGQTVKLSG